ncbi:MAG TPA: RodZ domain-containing protein [Candidatus Kapabacteria bacterium]|nr:RodZ domain-containing protein [Candidatus Kapabacteria bacterium]
MAQFTSDMLTPEIGAHLREARISRGLSVHDVAARLRVAPHYIDRMEEGDVRSLPPEPYRKSFIKEYARFVGVKIEQFYIPVEDRPEGLKAAVSAVDEVAKKAASFTKEAAQTTYKTTESVFKKTGEGVKDAVEGIRAKELWAEAAEVRRERLGIKPSPAEPPSPQIRPKEIAPQAKPIVAPPTAERPAEDVLDYDVLSRRNERRQPTQRINLDKEVRKEAESYEPEIKDYEPPSGVSRSTKVVVGLLIVIAAVLGYSMITKKSKTPPAPVVAEEAAPQTKISKKAAANQQVKPAENNAAENTSAAAAAAPLTFTVTATDSVWLSVTPDIGGGFRGKLNKGEVKSFTAKEKYIIYIGNQHALKMLLDGKPIDALPTVAGSNMVVRNVLLTKDKAVIAPSENTATEIKKQVIQNSEPVKKSAPINEVVPKHHSKPPPSPPPHEALSREKPQDKKLTQNPPIKKRIPTTPPLLPQPE